MLVRFTKGPVAARSDRLTCLRDDGTTTCGEMPRQGVLPRDAIHFVVESTLGWRDAFFGHVARGMAVDPARGTTLSPMPARDTEAQALQAESLVECLQAEQWGGAADPDAFRATLALTCARRQVAPPALATADLQRLRGALREFGAAWRPLPPGGSLERIF